MAVGRKNCAMNVQALYVFVKTSTACGVLDCAACRVLQQLDLIRSRQWPCADDGCDLPV